MMLIVDNDSLIGSVKSGVKNYSIKPDSGNRWKVGMNIEFWTANPRFKQLNPIKFGTSIVSDVFPITIDTENNKILFNSKIISNLDDLNNFAFNGGFENWNGMKNWFKKPFNGNIIFWKQFNKI
jgi:hypothetical protein